MKPHMKIESALSAIIALDAAAKFLLTAKLEDVLHGLQRFKAMYHEEPVRPPTQFNNIFFPISREKDNGLVTKKSPQV